MPNYPIPSCPVTIDPPNANGFSLQAKKSKDGIITEMGSKRTRRFNTSNVYVISAEFSFDTIDKFLYFFRWLKYETNYGNLWFKANWFSDIGFDAGEWVFRFVELPFSNTGYSQKHQATLLMGPYNDNVVSGDYTEVGIGGTFIDDDFPFGYDLFQVEQIIQNRIYASHQDFSFYAMSYNGSNITILNANTNTGDFPITVLYNIINACQISRTRFIQLMSKQTFSSPNYVQSLAVRTIDFINGVWSIVSENEVFTKVGHSGDADYLWKACVLSETEVAIISSDPNFPSLYLFLRKLVYSGGSWSTSGAEATITMPYADYYYIGITSLSSSRVCIIASGTLILIKIYDFSGSWSQFGADTDISDLYFITIIEKPIVARSETEITISLSRYIDEYTDPEEKLFDFKFNGTSFVQESESFIGLREFVLVREDIIIYFFYSSFYGSVVSQALKRTGGIWANYGGVEYDPNTILSQADTISYSGLPHFMWNN